jgi:hypothetical protein
MTDIPADERPSVFCAFIGGFMGASYACELEDGVLIYSQADEGYEWRVEEPERPLEWLYDETFLRLLDAEPPEARHALTAQRTRGPRFKDPTDAYWGEALRALHKLGAGDWNEHYEPAHVVCDGTHWSLEIVSPHLVVKSGGDNEYPPRFGTALEVIRKLLGGRDFG